MYSEIKLHLALREMFLRMGGALASQEKEALSTTMAWAVGSSGEGFGSTGGCTISSACSAQIHWMMKQARGLGVLVAACARP